MFSHRSFVSVLLMQSITVLVAPQLDTRPPMGGSLLSESSTRLCHFSRYLAHSFDLAALSPDQCRCLHRHDAHQSVKSDLPRSPLAVGVERTVLLES